VRGSSVWLINCNAPWTDKAQDITWTSCKFVRPISMDIECISQSRPTTCASQTTCPAHTRPNSDARDTSPRAYELPTRARATDPLGTHDACKYVARPESAAILALPLICSRAYELPSDRTVATTARLASHVGMNVRANWTAGLSHAWFLWRGSEIGKGARACLKLSSQPRSAEFAVQASFASTAATNVC